MAELHKEYLKNLYSDTLANAGMPPLQPEIDETGSVISWYTEDDIATFMTAMPDLFNKTSQLTEHYFHYFAVYDRRLGLRTSRPLQAKVIWTLACIATGQDFLRDPVTNVSSVRKSDIRTLAIRADGRTINSSLLSLAESAMLWIKSEGGLSDDQRNEQTARGMRIPLRYSLDQPKGGSGQFKKLVNTNKAPLLNPILKPNLGY